MRWICGKARPRFDALVTGFLPLMLGAVVVLTLALRQCLAEPAQGQEKTSLLRLTTDGDFKQHLVWSPDGQKLLFTRLHQGKMGLWLMNADGAELKPLLPAEKNPHFDGHFSPDGKKIVFVYDGVQGTDAKLHIHTVNVDGTENKVVIPHKGSEESPRFAPDGKRIAWVSTRDGNPEIYTADLDGKNIQRLTSESAIDKDPTWAPDGKGIAFTSARAGNLEIYRMNADGSGVRRLTQQPALDYWPAWSPDGRRIAFTSNRDGNYEIYVMNADGTELRNVSNHPGQDNYAAWSPDGQRIAFISNRHRGHDVYVIDLPR
jgi:TolB protein